MMNNAVNEHSYFVNEEAKAQKRKNDLVKETQQWGNTTRPQGLISLFLCHTISTQKPSECSEIFFLMLA